MLQSSHTCFTAMVLPGSDQLVNPAGGRSDAGHGLHKLLLVRTYIFGKKRIERAQEK